MNEYKYTKIFPYILIYFQCAHRKIRTFNCTGSKAVAYANSAIRAFWVWGRYRTVLSGSTNRRITLMLQTPYCSSIRIRTLTFSSVVKGAIRYTIELFLHPLKDSNFYQRFWRPVCYHCTKEMFVGIERLELSTPAVSERCANQLRHIPKCWECRIRTYGL